VSRPEDNALSPSLPPSLPTSLPQVLAKRYFTALYPHDPARVTDAFASFMGLFGQVGREGGWVVGWEERR
jgi:hypothetical protein